LAAGRDNDGLAREHARLSRQRDDRAVRAAAFVEFLRRLLLFPRNLIEPVMSDGRPSPTPDFPRSLQLQSLDRPDQSPVVREQREIDDEVRCIGGVDGADSSMAPKRLRRLFQQPHAVQGKRQVDGLSALRNAGGHEGLQTAIEQDRVEVEIPGR
jgi:hypothetical protein